MHSDLSDQSDHNQDHHMVDHLCHDPDHPDHCPYLSVSFNQRLNTCVINCSALCLLHSPALLVKPDDNGDNDDVGKHDDNGDLVKDDDEDEDDYISKDDDEAGAVTDYDPYKVFEHTGQQRMMTSFVGEGVTTVRSREWGEIIVAALEMT